MKDEDDQALLIIQRIYSEELPAVQKKVLNDLKYKNIQSDEVEEGMVGSLKLSATWICMILAFYN
jgi:hypothetical protein